MVRWRAMVAVEMAMSQSCSAVGSGMTAQSARKREPSLPTFFSSKSRTMREEAVSTWVSRGTIWKIGRRALDALEVAPEMRASAWPVTSIKVAK